MKKMLSTTLVAIAFAMVSTVDAKRMVARNTISANKQSAVNVIEAAKMAEENPTKQNKAELVAVIQEEANTPAKQETLDLRAEEKRILDGIKIVEERIKDTGYTWYNRFIASTHTKQAHAAATDRLNSLKAELKDVRAKLGENEKETGKAWSVASKLAIGVSLLVGASIGADVYYQTGYTKAAYNMLPSVRGTTGK